MRSLFALVIVVLLAGGPPQLAQGDSIDGRVTQVQLPSEDVTLYYIEAKGGFTVKLETKSTSVEGQKFYIGDGKIAVELVAHVTDGIFLQGVKYRQGDKVRTGSVIKVQPGYKKASELKPGDVYLTLPGVLFELPGK